MRGCSRSGARGSWPEKVGCPELASSPDSAADLQIIAANFLQCNRDRRSSIVDRRSSRNEIPVSTDSCRQHPLRGEAWILGEPMATHKNMEAADRRPCSSRISAWHHIALRGVAVRVDLERRRRIDRGPKKQRLPVPNPEYWGCPCVYFLHCRCC